MSVDFRDFQGLYTDSNYLQHHGILGMRWGVRRYQNKDGSLTAKGKARLSRISKDPKEALKTTLKAKKNIEL